MKNLFKSIAICGLFALICGAVASCTPDMEDDYKGPPVMEVGEPNVISALKVEIPLNAKAMASVGYKVVEVVEGQEPTAPANAMLLYRTGKKVDLSNKGKRLDKLVLTGDDGLDLNKSFIVYIAAAISDSEFFNEGEIYTVEFTTPNEYADDDVFIHSRTSNSLRVVVQFPESVKQNGRRIKWGVTNIATINYQGKEPLPKMLHLNEKVYPAYLFNRDTVLEINHDNVYRRNANGEIGYYYFAGYDKDGSVIVAECSANDPRVETGEAEPAQYYQFFQPGEPIVIMMSEVDYAACDLLSKLDGQEYADHIEAGDCDKKHPIVDWGWGPGWYWFPYDYMAYLKEVEGERDPGELPMPGVGGGNNNEPTIDFNKFWHDGAWYRQIETTLPGPEEFTTGDVKVNTSALKTDGGKIVFTPTGDTFAYFVGLYPEQSEMGAGYDTLLGMLDYKPQYLQWLTTAEIAPYLGIYPYYTSEGDANGTLVLDLEKNYADIQAGMKYHLLVNAVPGKMQNGDLTIDVSKQKFQHITFTLPSYTLPEPELVVTPHEAYSPYKVMFNIKNPNYETLPVKKVVFAANDTREFTSYMGAYDYTYSDIIMANDGWSNLTEAEVAQINTDYGYDIEFEVKEKSFFTLAVMGWNMEGRTSNPDKEGSQGVAEARSSAIPDAEQLDITKLNALKGDWTATATVKTYDYNTGMASSAQKSWKVSIGDLKTDNTFSADDYNVFEAAGVTKEDADAYLAEFNELSADYNASVRGQNRVLCQGWDLTGLRETSTASPWNLFLMPDYNASEVDYLFHDFGPKWFLQVDADGNVFIPVNYNVVPNMMCWYNGMEHYLCSGNYEKGIANYIKSEEPEDAFDIHSVGIPVEISEGGNTVTLKSVVVQNSNNGVTEDVTLYPTMLYNNQGSLAFFNPYVMSEVVLTKGWNGSATPAPAKLSTGKRGFAKPVSNAADFKAPTKPHSRTVFVPNKKAEGKVVKYKSLTKEEIRKGMDKYLSRFNGTVRK